MDRPVRPILWAALLSKHRSNMTEKYLTITALRRLLGVGKSSVYRLISKGFPRPIKIGRTSRWITDEINAWMAARAEERHERRCVAADASSNAAADAGPQTGRTIAACGNSNPGTEVCGPTAQNGGAA
jgi:prophage regulatory protein